jgi:hypothetical protein
VKRIDLSIIILTLKNTVQIFIVRMKLIYASFVLDPKHDQEAAGHSEGESRGVDKGESPVFPEISPGSQQIIFQHGTFIWFISRNGMPNIPLAENQQLIEK